MKSFLLPAVALIFCGCARGFDPAETLPACGDGTRSETEECDDGNRVSGDGCSAGCRLELGWVCDGQPSTCSRQNPPAGASGATGMAGPMGLSGEPGPMGLVGAVGPVGPAGPAGPAGGPVGPAGPAGPQGPVGPAGPIGAMGASGPAGPTGPVGATGATGPQGATGATGPMGPTGTAGAPGSGIVWHDANGIEIPGLFGLWHTTDQRPGFATLPTAFLWTDSLGHIWRFSAGGLALGAFSGPSPTPPVFSTMDCTGTEYTRVEPIPPRNYVFSAGTDYRVLGPEVPFTQTLCKIRVPQSGCVFIDTGSNACGQYLVLPSAVVAAWPTFQRPAFPSPYVQPFYPEFR